MKHLYNSDGDFVNDFEAMLARKREDSTKRRKRRDIDIINDNDDIIDQLIQDMRMAAEVRFLNKNKIIISIVNEFYVDIRRRIVS